MTSEAVFDAIIKVAAVITALGVIVAAIVKIRQKIKIQHKKIEVIETVIQDNETIKLGLLSLLRAELVRSGEKYLERESIQIYAKDAYDKAYQAYHALGGNGTMTQLHEQVMKLTVVQKEDNNEI